MLAVSLACRFQFFQRTQMQTARPTIPTNTPSIRPGSQAPTAAVYPANQPIMMAMAPMPFPSPQAAQYYIPQVTHPLTSILIESLVKKLDTLPIKVISPPPSLEQFIYIYKIYIEQ